MSRKIQQPNMEEQRYLNGAIDDSSDCATIRGHKYKLKYLKIMG